MARNGSGTMTPSVDFTTEAASPPIEIAKLDTALDDVAAELTNSIAADGQTNPTANLKMNGFKLTNLGAATALTDAVSATVVIDQELVYYVDSGAADAYVITPSPAIAAYEEGQRFAFRAANTSTGASTLNVNGLGAIAIQTNDAAALIAGSILAGGYYEVTYDANTSPDRWVLTRSNKLSDGMLSSNVPLKNAANIFTALQTVQIDGAGLDTNTAAGTPAIYFRHFDGDAGYVYNRLNEPLHFGTNNTTRLTISAAGAFDFKGGAVLAAAIADSDSETLVAGQLHFIDGNATLPNLTAGQWVQVINDSASPITISVNGSDTTYYALTGATAAASFTLGARGVLTARCNPAGTATYVSGSNITAVS